MKRIIRTVGIMLLCGILSVPVVEARGRQNQGGSNQSRPTTTQQRQPSRPGNSGGGNHNTGSRPGNQPASPSRPGNNQPTPSRPGNNQPTPSRPGNQPGTPGRPGNNQPAPSRPGNRPTTPSRPATPPSRPTGPYSHYYRPTPPSRPMLPPPRPYYRPTPPPSWRPVSTWRPFTSILGVAIGSAINASLNSLITAGYTISSYGNNAIYLTNVPMLNYYWPDATMYYNNGMLAGSQFVYYTGYNDLNRYNMVYNSLCGAYGMPVSLTTNGGITTASWWGTNNQFITLSYGAQYAGNGGLQYYTTLTFGI